MAYEAMPGHTRHWQKKLNGKKAEPARTVYTARPPRLVVRASKGVYRRVAVSAFDQGLEIPIAKVEKAARALSSHTLRVGLTQDLFAASEDGVGIAQALRVFTVDRVAPPASACSQKQCRGACCRRSEADNRLTR